MTVTNKENDPMTDTIERFTLAESIASDPQLEAIEMIVRLLELGPPPGRPQCGHCAYRLIGPLVSAAVGWSRGHAPDDAPDPDPGGELRMIDWTKEDVELPEPTTAMERWLRSRRAYDALGGQWYDRLIAVDPGLGCGLPISRAEP